MLISRYLRSGLVRHRLRLPVQTGMVEQVFCPLDHSTMLQILSHEAFNG